MAKPKFTKFVTAVGVTQFPHLLKPDTKFNEDGVYGTKLSLPEDAAGELMAELEPILDAYIEGFMNSEDMTPAKKKKWFNKDGSPKNVNDIGTEEVDDEGEETGNIVFNFKKPAKYKDKDSGQLKPVRAPALFDSEGDPIKKLEALWGGSKVAIAGHARPYAMESAKVFGLSLRVDAVMVAELVEGGAQDAAGFGFGKVEGGFKAKDASPFNGTTEADLPEDDDDEDDEDF